MAVDQRARLIEKIKVDHPCFGHFSVMNCMNLGYLKFKKDQMGITRCEKCPFEHICRKEAMKYAKQCDPYEDGQIDKPREWLKTLEGGNSYERRRNARRPRNRD